MIMMMMRSIFLLFIQLDTLNPVPVKHAKTFSSYYNISSRLTIYHQEVLLRALAYTDVSTSMILEEYTSEKMIKLN